MWKRVWETIKKPPIWLIAITYVCTVVFGAGSLVTLLLENTQWWFLTICYTSYALAAIFLSYAVYIAIRILPKTFKEIKTKLYEHRLTGTVLRNYGLRTVLTSALSTTLTLSYTVYNGVICVIYHSPWYGALAVYYGLLLAMRGTLLLYHGKNRGKEREKQRDLNRYRFCGIALMVMIITLSAAVVQMVRDGAGFEKPGILIYVFATYTFIKLAMSVHNFIKAKKQHDFTVDALRNINIADAFVSILALQTAMMHEFGDGVNAGLFNALTGSAVCLLVFALGLYMVIRSVRVAKKNKQQEEEVNGTLQQL